jgi:hypothetical protein
LIPNAGMLAGIATFNNFDPLLSARSLAFTDVLSETHSLALLRLADIRVLAAPSAGPDGLDWSAWPLVAQVDDVQFRAVPGEPARTRVVYSSIAVENVAEAASALRSDAFDPDQSVIVEPAVDAPEASLPEGADGSERLTFVVSLERDGWLVLSDAAYPGWIAFVDGAPVPVHPANLAFRAVRVPVGEHTVVWIYQSSSWNIGRIASLTGLALWSALAVTAILFRRRPGT